MGFARGHKPACLPPNPFFAPLFQASTVLCRGTYSKYRFSSCNRPVSARCRSSRLIFEIRTAAPVKTQCVLPCPVACAALERRDRLVVRKRFVRSSAGWREILASKKLIPLEGKTSLRSATQSRGTFSQTQYVHAASEYISIPFPAVTEQPAFTMPSLWPEPHRIPIVAGMASPTILVSVFENVQGNRALEYILSAGPR